MLALAAVKALDSVAAWESTKEDLLAPQKASGSAVVKGLGSGATWALQRAIPTVQGLVSRWETASGPETATATEAVWEATKEDLLAPRKAPGSAGVRELESGAAWALWKAYPTVQGWVPRWETALGAARRRNRNKNN